MRQNSGGGHISEEGRGVMRVNVFRLPPLRQKQRMAAEEAITDTLRAIKSHLCSRNTRSSSPAADDDSDDRNYRLS